jgi:hypothetical protein
MIKMATIQERIDELQKELVAQKMAESEQERRKLVVDGSIKQLEEFCHLSDKILDKPSEGAAARAVALKLQERHIKLGHNIRTPLPPSPGETLKEVFKNRLDPTHELYKSYNYAVLRHHNHKDEYEAFNDWYKFKLAKTPALVGSARHGLKAATPAVELEIMKNEWARELENRVYSTTGAGDMYINETLKCILAIVKKQQEEINWLKSKLN